jgi:hypothetical protein
MSFFWRGVDGTEYLARELLLRGGENLRHSAFDFIGRSLMNTEGEVPAESLARIQSLWEWWRQDGAERRLIGKEVETFGWWFASQQCDWGWAEAQAVWVLVSAQRLSQITSWWKAFKNGSRTIHLAPSEFWMAFGKTFETRGRSTAGRTNAAMSFRRRSRPRTPMPGALRGS